MYGRAARLLTDRGREGESMMLGHREQEAVNGKW
jgi:hypothetical protein